MARWGDVEHFDKFVHQQLIPMSFFFLELAHLGGEVLSTGKTLSVITSYHWFSVRCTESDGVLDQMHQLSSTIAQLYFAHLKFCL
jgi:hypothetical protein